MEVATRIKDQLVATGRVERGRIGVAIQEVTQPLAKSFGLDRPAFWATLTFFPLCIWQGGRRYLREPAVRLAGLGFVVAVIPFLLLEQTTVADRPDGDLGVIAMMALVLVFMASLRFAFGEFSELASRRGEAGLTVPVRTMVLGGFLAVMLGAGVIDLLGAAGVLPEW
jgi:hypothetical protein